MAHSNIDLQFALMEWSSRAMHVEGHLIMICNDLTLALAYIGPIRCKVGIKEGQGLDGWLQYVVVPVCKTWFRLGYQ